MVDLSNWMEEARQQWEREQSVATKGHIAKRLEAIEHRLLKIELLLSGGTIIANPAVTQSTEAASSDTPQG